MQIGKVFGVVIEVKERTNFKLILAAGSALAIGILVYLFDRRADVYFLPEALSASNNLPALFGILGHSLPSLLHVYAFILLTAACLPRGRAWALAACLSWFAIECLFEAGQHPRLRNLVVSRIPEWFDGVPLLEASRNYFLNGIYDPLDIAASAAGAAAAWLTIRLTRTHNHAKNPL